MTSNPWFMSQDEENTHRDMIMEPGKWDSIILHLKNPGAIAASAGAMFGYIYADDTLTIRDFDGVVVGAFDSVDDMMAAGWVVD